MKIAIIAAAATGLALLLLRWRNRPNTEWSHPHPAVDRIRRRQNGGRR